MPRLCDELLAPSHTHTRQAANRAIEAAQHETVRVRLEFESKLAGAVHDGHTQQLELLNASQRAIASLRESNHRQIAEKDQALVRARFCLTVFASSVFLLAPSIVLPVSVCRNCAVCTVGR